MLELEKMSERRACRPAGLSRDAFRHEPVSTPATQALPARLVKLAQARRRFGYRSLHDLLDKEFPEVNHKTIYRLYQVQSWPCAGARRPNSLAALRQKLVPAPCT